MSLDQYEAEARAYTQQLEDAGKVPFGYTADHHPLTAGEQAELKRLKHALTIATDADTFVALVKGQAVHESRLDPEQVRILKQERHRVTPHRDDSTHGD